jgi:hypothetical protein
MAHAARTMHDHRLTVDQSKHAIFWAGTDASPAADTARQIHRRVLEPSLVGALFARPGALALSARLLAQRGLSAYEQGDRQHEDGDDQDE